MESKNGSLRIGLTHEELKLLVQSLSNCVETCRERGHGAHCEDCDAATALRHRLEQSLAA